MNTVITFFKIIIYKVTARLRESLRYLSYLVKLPSSRSVEYDFAHRAVPSNERLYILDIGSYGPLLPLILAKEGHNVTAYDFRGYPEKNDKLVSFTGDFLKNSLPDNHFDIIMLISCIEHVGFSGYNDPRYIDGDYKIIKEVRRLLKPNGKLIMTFPYFYQEKIIPGFERWYHQDRIASLFFSFEIVKSQYYIPKIRLFNRWLGWKGVDIDQSIEFTKKYETQGCACFILSRQEGFVGNLNK